MAERSFVIGSPYLLLVEGIEEVRFWAALLKVHSRNDIQTLAAAGKTRLATELSTIVQTPGFDDVRWLGVAQDADDNSGAAFDRIRSALRAASLSVPNRPWEQIGSSPEVVAFVLPDGQNTGDVETLVWQAVQGEPAVPCVNAYFECLRTVGMLPRQLSKARIHAYLASLNRPDQRLGEAAEAGVLPLNSPVFGRFLGLLPAI